ncbi:MAG: serine--tRNA ligase [Candidatus Pacebacteria bacterium]|nr:serine--tRNA ligase [Candidatus Paceibacterota bacterium]
MLDIKFIRENKELIKKAIFHKNIDLDLEKLLLLDRKRRNLIQEVEKLKSEQKKTKDIKKAKGIKEKIKKLLPENQKIEKEYQELMLLVPNLYSEDTPIGKDESSNKEILRWGKIPVFDFPIKNHIELGKNLDLIDLEKGTKTSGFRGYYLKNELALISMALIWHTISVMRKKGFSFMIPPTILKEFALIGSGHFPFGQKEIYKINESSYLAGTSEPSLLAYFSDMILENLPIKVFAFSQCYRSEAGSYGKDTKGLYRKHEFMKVEQVVLCKNNLKESNYWLEEMRKNSEEILQSLELPYRVIQICTGDMGAGKYKMYDIETWMPSRNSYGETHSDSNLTDWQARRLNIKDKDKNFVYTLNNTVIALPRILISILENYQEKDGSIKIPKVLQTYLGFKKINVKKTNSN